MRQRTWKAWGSVEEAELIQMRRDGMTAREIARHLGRTLESVRNRLVALKVKKPPLRLRWWLEVLRRPHRCVLLARELGLTPDAVRQAKRKLRRLGYDVPDASGRGPIKKPG